MKTYLEKRERNRRQAIIGGVMLAVAAHVVVFLFCSFKGLKYIWPPPAEQTFLMDFSAEMEEVDLKYGKEPVTETVDLERPVELVQSSESPVVDNTPNETPETQPDDFGDVPVPTPEPEQPKLDPRASFPGMAKKDSDAGTAHDASEAKNKFKAGQSDGNSVSAAISGKSNAHLEGRKVDGNLIKPVYDRQESGIVVVKIWVDPYGQVTRALPGAEGTTTTDPQLWNAARNAAMATHFSQLGSIDSDTPPLQEGTITYIFNLK